MALLKNPRTGRIVEIEGQAMIERFIKKDGLIIVSPEEKESYLKQRNRVIPTPPAGNKDGIYFRQNAINPHGYGESTIPLINSL